MAKTKQEIIDSYIDDMVDGDFVIEHEEGRNKHKIMTPEQAEQLAKLKDAATAASNGGSILKRIRS